MHIGVMENEYKVIHFGFCETKCKQGGSKFGKPSPRCLLETIDRLMRFANMMRKLAVNKSWWLFIKDLLL